MADEDLLFTLTPDERELIEPELAEIARCNAIIRGAQGAIMRSLQLKAGRRDITFDFRTFEVRIAPKIAGVPAGLTGP